MPAERVEDVAIDELVLRLPGIGRDEAPALARAIARRVQERLRGSGRVGRIELARITVTVRPGLSPDRLADELADQVLEVLA